MANRVILTRKEQFDREIAAYRGDDPLKLRYDFLLWLDSNFGKDKVIDLFTSTLEEALNTHWNDARYKEDNRLIELQMIYATLQPNPLTVYQSYYDRGVAQQSSVLYVNWANHLAANGDFTGADKIFKMGSEKTSSTVKAELIKAFEKFLAVVGRKYLDGEIPAKKEVQCTKCHAQQSAVAAPAAEDVKALEMNPGKAGCYDDFPTAVAYFDPPDNKSIRMYPKDKVYKDPGKEYSLEEIKAEEYFEKLRKKEQQEALKLKEKAKKFDPPFEADHVMKEGVFPTPLLPCSGKEDSITAQSFTTRTKLAMHLVQDMWSSPTPEVQPPTMAKNEENKPKSAFPIYVDENPETPKAAEKKPVAPFQVFADSPDDPAKSIKNPVSLAKKSSTAKKNGLQTKPNVLSERKLNNEEILEEPKAGVKQQLHFESDAANEMLAHKLGETSVSDPCTPFQPFGGIKPLFPVEQGKDDFSDVTCNTKAFNFALPSSTPVQQRKSLAPYHSAHQSSGSNIPHDERPSYQTQQNLSVILEASKERCSSSGSSTGSSQPRTPAFPAKTPIKALSNLSGVSSCSGTVLNGSAQGNRSFSWMSIRSKSNLNLSLRTPNRSQSNDENDSPATYTCSFLKFRLSSEKLSALKSIKENYFRDRSESKPLLKVPLAERHGNGSVEVQHMRSCKPKDGNISKQLLDTSLRHQPQAPLSFVSVLGDSSSPQVDFASEKKYSDYSHVLYDSGCARIERESSSTSKAVGSKCSNRDPRIRNKFKRKRSLCQRHRLSISSLVSNSADCSLLDHSRAKVKEKVKQNVGRSKLELAGSDNPLKHDDLGTCRSFSSPRDSLNAPKETSPSSAMKSTEKSKSRRKSFMSVINHSSFSVPITPDILQIRKCSILLSPVNSVNESNCCRQTMKRNKRGRPRKRRISQSLLVNTEDSPFTLCSFRKETSKIDMKRTEPENLKLSVSRRKPKQNAHTTRSSINVDTQLNEQPKRPLSDKRSKTWSVSCCKKKGVLVKDVTSKSHDCGSIPDCGPVTRNKSCYKTPINNKKMMPRSESCPVHMSETVARNRMTSRSNSGGFTPLMPKGEYGLRSKSRAWSYVPKQLITDDCNDIDPFCSVMNDRLLSLMNFPQPHHADGYLLVNTNLPTVSKNFRLGNELFTTCGDIGKGAYARVVKASTENSNFALKIEKPACKWEFYIAKEIQRRVDAKKRSGFMDIKSAYIYTNGSVLVTEWAKHGSLLNIINLYKQKTGKVFEPVLSLHFAIEVTRAIEYLHKCKIIHGDVKPDNFVVRSLPTANETEPCLMLIDFGRSIDMTLFPEGTKFSRVVTTDGFQCNEMKEQKPWTYQADLYGLAGSIYCLLIGEYMKVVKKNDEWKLHKALPRNVKRELWEPIFHQLLNVPSCEQLPSLTEIRKTLEAAFDYFNHYVKLQYFNHLSNIVMGK